MSWIMQGDPQYAFVLAGSNEETEVALLPRDERVAAQEEAVWPQAGLMISSSDSTEKLDDS